MQGVAVPERVGLLRAVWANDGGTYTLGLSFPTGSTNRLHALLHIRQPSGHEHTRVDYLARTRRDPDDAFALEEASPELGASTRTESLGRDHDVVATAPDTAKPTPTPAAPTAVVFQNEFVRLRVQAVSVLGNGALAVSVGVTSAARGAVEFYCPNGLPATD